MKLSKPNTQVKNFEEKILQPEFLAIHVTLIYIVIFSYPILFPVHVISLQIIKKIGIGTEQLRDP